MGRAWFEYKGVDSRDMHLHIENDIVFSSPEVDLEFIEILGRDGDVVIDNERLKSVPFSIPVRIKTPGNVTINEAATNISNWLKSNVGYHPLVFSGSPDYEYIAIIKQQFDISETLINYGRTVLNFRLQPYKRSKNSSKQTLANGATLVNNYSRESKPLIRIEGSGDIDIKNNGIDWLKLRSIDTFITIDSELGQVYRGNRPQYSKVIDLGENQFPLLEKGFNTISWTGNITKLEILPRWEVIA